MRLLRGLRSWIESLQPADRQPTTWQSTHGGARSVIGFDFDQGALDIAFDRARSENLAFTPLFLDVTNPAPDQGWGQAERRGLRARAKADGVLALALIHHVAIAKNVPLGDVVSWLTDMVFVFERAVT